MVKKHHFWYSTSDIHYLRLLHVDSHIRNLDVCVCECEFVYFTICWKNIIDEDSILYVVHCNIVHSRCRCRRLAFFTVSHRDQPSCYNLFAFITIPTSTLLSSCSYPICWLFSLLVRFRSTSLFARSFVHSLSFLSTFYIHIFLFSCRLIKKKHFSFSFCLILTDCMHIVTITFIIVIIVESIRWQSLCTHTHTHKYIQNK